MTRERYVDVPLEPATAGSSSWMKISANAGGKYSQLQVTMLLPWPAAT